MQNLQVQTTNVNSQFNVTESHARQLVGARNPRALDVAQGSEAFAVAPRERLEGAPVMPGRERSQVPAGDGAAVAMESIGVLSGPPRLRVSLPFYRQGGQSPNTDIDITIIRHRNHPQRQRHPCGGGEAD